MASFRDCKGVEWQVEFDALVFERIRDETKIDLADVTGGGFEAIGAVPDQAAACGDVTKLVRVLRIICEPAWQAKALSGDAFSKLIRGESIATARAAILGGAADFFPANEWSAILLNLGKRATFRKSLTDLALAAPLLEQMDRLPKEARDAAMALASGGLQTLESAAGSASGPDATQSSAVGS